MTIHQNHTRNKVQLMKQVFTWAYHSMPLTACATAFWTCWRPSQLRKAVSLSRNCEAWNISRSRWPKLPQPFGLGRIKLDIILLPPNPHSFQALGQNFEREGWKWDNSSQGLLGPRTTSWGEYTSSTFTFILARLLSVLPSRPERKCRQRN